LAIGRVLDDDDLAARLGAAGRKRVIDNYTWSVVAARTADWYRECLTARGQSSTDLRDSRVEASC
jgi:glycosyltransferase involved in cell wall biosynthesis